MAQSDHTNYTLAGYLIDGFNANCHQVIGTDLTELADGGGYQAKICLAAGASGSSQFRWSVESRSRDSWLEAAEGAVRQALWSLEDREVERGEWEREVCEAVGGDDGS